MNTKLVNEVGAPELMLLRYSWNMVFCIFAGRARSVSFSLLLLTEMSPQAASASSYARLWPLSWSSDGRGAAIGAADSALILVTEARGLVTGGDCSSPSRERPTLSSSSRSLLTPRCV